MTLDQQKKKVSSYTQSACDEASIVYDDKVMIELLQKAYKNDVLPIYIFFLKANYAKLVLK